MQHNFDGLRFSLGNASTLAAMPELPPLAPFSPEAVALLDAFSRAVLRDPEAKSWSDVISLGFWCRSASVAQMQASSGSLAQRFGRGVAFHIAPGNVAVNFAFSLFTGLLTGNANVVRLPGRDHPQVAIITRLLQQALDAESVLTPYICLVRYEHQQTINDALSALCDTRIIWGGDNTIEQIRRAPLKPRALDIAFSDRYSIAAIDADSYLAHQDKKQLAQAFYNDTLLNDQNACSSPSLVVWLGQEIAQARDVFWSHFQTLAESRYHPEAISAVDKLTRLCLLSTHYPGAKKVPDARNLVMRIELPSVDASTLTFRGNCGFFMEYVARNLSDLTPVCGERCQTLATFGIDSAAINRWFAQQRPKGVDRVVALGQTLDFTLQWDGYDLVAMLTRRIAGTQ